MAIARRWVDSFNRGDIGALEATVAPDFRLHEWPDAPGARTYQGPGAIREAIATWFESWEWMTVEIEDTLEAGDKVLVQLHQRAAGKGSTAEVEIRTYNVYSFKDGKLSELHLFTDRESADRVLAG